MNTNNTELHESITLYYQDGSSDKVYHAQIEKQGTGFLVNFSFGRRGSSLQSGTKTSKPVPIEAAAKIFAALVSSKKAKGYTEGLAGTPYLASTKEERVSGVNCQLLNAIDEAELSQFVSSPDYGAQEKMDGNRLLIQKQANTVEGINRKGLFIAISKAIEQEALLLAADYLIDGEAIGDTFYAFDLVSLNETDFHARPYKERFALLTELLLGDRDRIRLLPLVTSPVEKHALLQALQADGKEGIVFKDLNAPYKAGRPASRGAQIKFKFYDTATAKVAKVNLKRSIAVRMREGCRWIPVGNVTISPNFEIPAEGDIVEVRYLYAYKGGSLYQPTYLGKRMDADEDDCDMRQLKYKNG